MSGRCVWVVGSGAITCENVPGDGSQMYKAKMNRLAQQIQLALGRAQHAPLDFRVTIPFGALCAPNRTRDRATRTGAKEVGSKQRTNETMEDNFRLLNRSLKNVEIILYDELLDNVRNFLKRLRKT
jgi:hypothetical protein